MDSRLYGLDVLLISQTSPHWPLIERLWFVDSSLASISVFSATPHLKEFYCQKDPGRPSIKDLSSLSSCTTLEVLEISYCPLITSLAPLSTIKSLKELFCNSCPLVNSLTSLSTLNLLQTLQCSDIDSQTSLLPLTSCTGLKELKCDEDAVDLEELRSRKPKLQIKHEVEEVAEDD